MLGETNTEQGFKRGVWGGVTQQEKSFFLGKKKTGFSPNTKPPVLFFGLEKKKLLQFFKKSQTKHGGQKITKNHQKKRVSPPPPQVNGVNPQKKTMF